ncbi:MAG: YceI family protein [Rugosibacter sp.]|jgi:polyisoprenoid-binding protein YceI|nr:YceI family protein [Rugosibacter sp.]
MIKKISFFALLTCFTSSLLAAPETYVIESSHTFPRFEYSHLGYSTQVQRFNKTTGKITLDRTAGTGSVDVIIDAKSVDTGFALFDTHIQSTDFFDTATFPTITFKSDQLAFASDKLVSVVGNLTIKGITQKVKLDVTSFHCMPHPMLKKDACGANATTKIKRSDFAMGKHAPFVGDEVTLTIPVEAVKE